MIRREKYLKTASRLRQVVVKQGQKINADKRISDLEEKIALARQALADKRAQLAFGSQGFAFAA